MWCSCSRPPCGLDSDKTTDRPVRAPADAYVHEPEEEDCWKAADELFLQDGTALDKASAAKEKEQVQQPQELFCFVAAGGSEGEEGSLGLDIDIVDSVSAVVVGINPGPVQRWNAEHPDAALHEGDRIVEVNGAVGDAALIAERLKRDGVWSLLVQRPVEAVVASGQLWRLVREGGCPCRPHGVHVGFAEHGTTLMIDQIHEGLVMCWNQANPEQQVKVKDRIVEVNFKRGQASDLVQLLSGASESLQLVIRRYP